MTKPISNQGIVINGGSFHAGTVAVGDSARAVSHGAEPVAPAAPLRPPAKIRVGQQPVEATPLSRVPSHWDAFLSHASEDKDFVEPLVDALTARGLTIWYDRSNLRIGNSLREAIDLGLVESEFGIVILSSRYFAKSWARQEVNGLLSREANGDRVVLPIWHGVTRAEVTRFSPILADRIAARSSDSLDAIAEALVRSIRNGVRTG